MAAVKSQHILIFTLQFASMMKSKLPLVDVLDNLASETPQKKFRAVLEEIVEDVRHGIDLGSALEQQDRVFDDVYVNVVKSGMESAHLDSALAQIAHYLQVMDETGRKVRKALSYPLFVIGAFILIFNAMVFMILPNFSKMYEQFDRELPVPTQWLLNIGAFWAANWHLIVGGIAIFVFGFLVWTKTPDGRYTWDRYKLYFPLLGRLWRMAALARFLRTLSVQVSNDVRLVNALRLSADASGNQYIRGILYEIAEDVETGAGIAQSFRNHDIFQGIVLQMIASGEESGVLDELLLSSADYFDSLVQDLLDHITGLINPVLTIFVGLAVTGMMVASFLPVFDMGAAVG